MERIAENAEQKCTSKQTQRIYSCPHTLIKIADYLPFL